MAKIKKPTGKQVGGGIAATLGTLVAGFVGYGELKKDKPIPADPNVIAKLSSLDKHLQGLDTELKINRVRNESRFRDIENKLNAVESLQRIYHQN